MVSDTGRVLKLTLAYDGTDYAGWQVQRASTQHSAHSTQKPTIQGTLEKVLGQILQEPVRVVGSGRTDAGAHAEAQVAHIRIRSATTASADGRRRSSGGRSMMPADALRRAANALLPPDIVVTKVAEAPADFHARFDARHKRYRYRLVNGPVVLPFERRCVHQIRSPLNLALMRREAAALVGRHDMRAFHKTSRPVRDTRRRISELSIRRRGDHVTLEIEADGFLHTMVRTIVGTLLDVGRGRRPPGTMAALLKRRDRRAAGPSAPAKGLCLVAVRY